MRNFIIIFTEKEGSTPLVRMLDKFEQISMLHQHNDKAWQAWEPFNHQECGSMPMGNLQQCLDMLFNNEPTDFEQLNQIYTRTATDPLERVNQNGAVGFKMRFFTPENPLHIVGAQKCNKLTQLLFRKLREKSFKTMMLDVLKKNNVVVFFAVRQDLLRWGLSKYHGDGTGKTGHLQFRLAIGNIKSKDIGKMTVDCKKLEKIIAKCEKSHRQRRSLMAEMNSAGIQAYPLCYEGFLTDKRQYFKQIAAHLELDLSKQQLDAVLESEQYFKKVHSDDIADIVVNHQEVMQSIGDRFFSWQS